MTHGPRYYVKHRRRREGKTDYRKRLCLLRSSKTRFVVRKSLKNTQIQFVQYKEDGDKIILAASSKELKDKFKWRFSTSTIPAAYLTGLLAGTRAKEKGISECVLDIGRYPASTGCKIFAALKGVIETGLTCAFSEEKFPSEDRIMGKHLDKEISSSVNDIKSKIVGGK